MHVGCEYVCTQKRTHKPACVLCVGARAGMCAHVLRKTCVLHGGCDQASVHTRMCMWLHSVEVGAGMLTEQGGPSRR